MRLTINVAWERLGPALALGLFFSRISAEQLLAGSPLAATGLTGQGALILSLAAVAMAWMLLRQIEFSLSWPLLFLLLYVFHPGVEPKVALSAALLATLAALQTVNLNRWQFRQKINFNVLSIALIVVLFLVLYVATLAGDVLSADNGEFQLVSYSLGVAHPPGFPLYTLLGNAISRLPLGDSAALRISSLSVVTSTLTLLITYLSVVRLTGRRLPGFTATIALGTSTTFWAQATTANIRSLTGLFAASAFYLLLRFSETVRSGAQSRAVGRMEGGEGPAEPSPDRYLIQFALVLSLGIFHHASLAIMGIVFLAFLLTMDRSLLGAPRRWFRPLLASLIGMLPLLYLPWRGLVQSGGTDVRGASSALMTLEGFLNHVLALGFRGDFFHFLEPSVFWERIKVMGNVMTFQFDPLMLGGIAIGFALVLWRARPYALLFGGSFIAHTFVTATYRAPQTVEYMLPAYVPAAITLGYAMGEMLRLNEKRQSLIGIAVAQSFIAIMFVGSINQGLRHYPSFRVQRDASSTRVYAQSLLDQTPPMAVILADWHWVTPLWYLQEVESQRTDVNIQYVFPTSEPYAQTWSRRIREELDAGQTVVATHFEESFYSMLPPPQPIGDAFLYGQEPLDTLPSGFVPSDVILGDVLHIAGYDIEHRHVAVGQEITLTIAWRPISELPAPTSLFAHLVGDGSQIYAQDDPLARPQAQGMTLTQFRLTPRLGATPGEYEILVGAYGDVALTDAEGRTRTPLTGLAVIPTSTPPVTNHPMNRLILGDGSRRRLIGYDWDMTLSGRPRLYLHWRQGDGYYTETRDVDGAGPVNLANTIGPWGVAVGNWSIAGSQTSHYVPFGHGIVWMGTLSTSEESLRAGDGVLLRQTFRSSRPILRNIATSVRLIGYDEDAVQWAWWDLDDEFGIPAMGAIPTLKWIAGSTVHDPHRLTVDSSAYPGQIVGATVTLYETITSRPLPILDERFTRETPWHLTSIAP